MNPSALSFSTEYNQFKNNDYVATSVSTSGTVTASSDKSTSTTITLDRESSVAEIYFTVSQNSSPSVYTTGTEYQLPTIISYDNGSTVSSPGTAVYSVQFITNFTATTLTITAYILNPYAENLSSINNTYTLKVFTTVAPFVS